MYEVPLGTESGSPIAIQVEQFHNFVLADSGGRNIKEVFICGNFNKSKYCTVMYFENHYILHGDYQSYYTTFLSQNTM